MWSAYLEKPNRVSHPQARAETGYRAKTIEKSAMSFLQDHLNELNLLALFDPVSSLEGLKVHQHSADPAMVAAAERLYQKGLITQKDGGYLTPLGSETAEHVQKVLTVLSSSAATS